MKILLIDNYDSFTYNIVHALRQLGHTPDVRRNDTLTVSDAAAYDRIIISPGPGIPSEAGIVPQVLRELSATHPILGVCLGHQAIAENFGATLVNLPEVYHGLKLPVRVVANDPLFAGMPRTFDVGRYHSWAVSPENLPECLEVTAVDPDGVIMALRHRTLNIHGVQFHPESIMTDNGMQIFQNWLNL